MEPGWGWNQFPSGTPTLKPPGQLWQRSRRWVDWFISGGGQISHEGVKYNHSFVYYIGYCEGDQKIFVVLKIMTCVP